MKVFISWSGKRAQAVAAALAPWLRKLFEGAEVFYSTRDIAAGDAWLPALFKELRESGFGVVCLTPENQGSPWLLFETGAIWRGLEGTRVVPYCHDLDPQAVGEPFNHLQGVADNQEGTWRLVQSLNACRAAPRPETDLKEVFDALWPSLATALQQVKDAPAAAPGRGTGLCAGITGAWWERVRPDKSTALSYVGIEPDPATGTVRLVGRAYNMEGRQVARWESVAACVDEVRRKVFYYWKGDINTETGPEAYAGFAELAFETSGGIWSRGSGFFSDTNLRDMTLTTRKSVDLFRCSPDDERVMAGDDAQAIGERIRASLKRLG